MRRSRRAGSDDTDDGVRAPGSARQTDPVISDAVRLELEEINSFEDFYTAEFGRMSGLAFQLAGRRDVAEDLAQEAMVRAYRAWGRISSYDRPDLWLRRTVINLATSRWRRQRTVAKSLFRLTRPREVPEPTAETREVWRRVRELPERQAQAIALYYGSDLSVAEVAEVLDCAPGTVRTHLARGRAALAEKLADWREER